MLKLRHFSDNQTKDISLTPTTLHMGKDCENDISLYDEDIPDIAAEITFCENSFTISAIQLNHLCINGKKHKEKKLLPGDRIEIGSHLFCVDQTDTTNNITHFDHTNQTHLESLTQFVEAVGRERDLYTLLRKIIETLFNMLGGDDAFIFKLDKQGKPQLFVSSDKNKTEALFSDTIVQTTLKKGEGLFIPNALDDPTISPSQSIIDFELTSILCSPIKVADCIIGIIYLGARKRSTSFSKDDLEILNTFAVIAGMLINHVEFISQQRRTIQELTAHQQDYQGIIAESKEMREVLKKIDTVAISSIGILLEGETGTGKDLLASLIHSKSDRSEKPFVNVNCSSIQKDLQESEFFGHKKGSFTGATKDHKGLFASAHGGTIFLNEISDMEIGLQAKFLRVLESGMLRPVGSSQEVAVDVRVICATNKNLENMVKERTFREDLFYRINQFKLVLPPLRERGEDCVLLAYYFLEKYRSEYPNREIIDFHPDTLAFIQSHNWPGNVRELASAIHTMVLSSTSPLGSIHSTIKPNKELKNFDDATKDFQKQLIQKTLRFTSGNKEQAAKQLGMSRSTFFRYLSSLSI